MLSSTPIREESTGPKQNEGKCANSTPLSHSGTPAVDPARAKTDAVSPSSTATLGAGVAGTREIRETQVPIIAREQVPPPPDKVRATQPDSLASETDRAPLRNVQGEKSPSSLPASVEQGTSHPSCGLLGSPSFLPGKYAALTDPQVKGDSIAGSVLGHVAGHSPKPVPTTRTETATREGHQFYAGAQVDDGGPTNARSYFNSLSTGGVDGSFAPDRSYRGFPDQSGIAVNPYASWPRHYGALAGLNSPSGPLFTGDRYVEYQGPRFQIPTYANGHPSATVTSREPPAVGSTPVMPLVSMESVKAMIAAECEALRRSWSPSASQSHQLSTTLTEAQSRVPTQEMEVDPRSDEDSDTSLADLPESVGPEDSSSLTGTLEPVSTTHKQREAVLSLRGVLGLPDHCDTVSQTKHRTAAHRFLESEAPLLPALPQSGLVDLVLDKATRSIQGKKSVDTATLTEYPKGLSKGRLLRARKESHGISCTDPCLATDSVRVDAAMRRLRPDSSTPSTAKVPWAAMENFESSARRALRQSSIQDLFLDGAIVVLQQDEPGARKAALSYLSEVATAMEKSALESASVLGNALLLRRDACLEGTTLDEATRRSLRCVPLSAPTLFGDKFSEFVEKRASEMKDRAIEKAVLVPTRAQTTDSRKRAAPPRDGKSSTKRARVRKGKPTATKPRPTTAPPTKPRQSGKRKPRP